MTSTSRLARGFRATLVGRLVRMVASGLLVVLLTRFLLAPEEYGLLFLAISILTVAQLFSDAGIGKSAARYLTDFRESDPALVRPVVRASLKLRLAAVGVVGFGLFASATFVADLLDEPGLAVLLYAGVAYLVARSLFSYASLLFQGFNRVTWTARLNVVSGVGQPVFVTAFVLAGFGTVGAVFGYAVAVGLGALVGFVVLYWRFYLSYPAGRSDEAVGKRVLRYSVPLAVTRGANVLDRQVDTILIGFFLNPLAVGFYTLAKQINGFLLAPSASLGFTISPTFGEGKAREDTARASHIYQTALEHTLLLYVPAATGLIVVAEPAVTLVFGADYAGAVPVVQILSAYLLLQAITNVTSDGIDFLGRARFRAVAKGATSVANFVLNLLLIPRFGVVGAASATVATHAVYVLLNLYVIDQEFSLSVASVAKTTAGVLLITGVMGAAISLLVPYASNVLFLLVVVLLGALVWIGMATISGLLDVRRLYAVVSS